MNKQLWSLTLASALLFASCNNEQKNAENIMNNPLLQAYSTPFEVPPFHLIQNNHFAPAFEEAIKIAQKEVAEVAENTNEPTFSNTIEALEKTGSLLDKVSTVFFNLSGAHTNDTIKELAKEIAPKLSKHRDDIYLNENLFARVQKLWDNKNALHLNTEQSMLLEKTYKAFVLSGANLSIANKSKLRKINEELSVLSVSFGDNILSENKSYELVLDSEEQLAGLPEGLIAAAAEDAAAKGKEGKWVFTLDNPSVMPFLQYSSNRELRKQIWSAYQSRGNNNNNFDNKEIVIKLANLRMEKAQLLGYASHAHYILEETMSKNPNTVFGLLDKLWEPALAKAKIETEDIKKMMQKEGINDDVQPYDWRYYAEKIRKQRFDLDEQELKPYFSLDNVRQGIFDVTQKLYGLQFIELNDVPKYHEDVTVWEVKEADGSHVGILYMDFFPRASKRGGAWMTSYRKQATVDGKRVAPVISIVCNFTKPVGDMPSLLTFDEASTFFHEFGHALHGLLSNVQYKMLSGTSVPRDFVELPSQIMENWAAEPAVMKQYAKHYKTNQPIPDALIKKIQNAGTFDQGFATLEYLAASYLDLNYHTAKENIQNVNEYEQQSMQKLGLISSIIPRYRSTYFNHVFAGGYSAGYYSYIWSGVLDTDAFEAFKTTDLFSKEKADAFRKNILEKGGTEDPAVLYRNFRGQDPDIQPLLRKRGLDTKSNVQLKKD